MMNVFLLTKNFPPVICGVGDYTFELYTRLKAKGHDVKIVTSANESVREYCVKNGLTNDVYPVVTRWGFSSIPVILRLVKKNKTDLFFVQYVPNALSKIGLPFFLIALQLLLRIRGVRFGIFFHEVSLRVFHNGLKSFVLSVPQRIISYLMYSLSSVSLTNNLLYKSYFYPFKTRVLPVPANIYGQHESVFGSLNIDRGSNEEIMLASFANRVGMEVLEAIKDCIYVDDLRLKLVLLGNVQDEARQSLTRQINELGLSTVVSFYEETSRVKIADVLYQATIFLHLENVSGRGEGGASTKSGVMAAAMAAGLPIISTKGDMTDEFIFQSGENIVFAEGRDSIRHNIKALCSDHVMSQKLSSNALRTYQQKMSWEVTISAYGSILEGKHGVI